MDFDPNNIYQKLITLGEAWANLNGAADLFEETKKTLIAKLMNECLDKSSAAKETYALSRNVYQEHIEKMVEARRAANIAKVRYDAAKVFCDMKRTEAANERAANRLAS